MEKWHKRKLKRLGSIVAVYFPPEHFPSRPCYLLLEPNCASIPCLPTLATLKNIRVNRNAVYVFVNCVRRPCELERNEMQV